MENILKKSKKFLKDNCIITGGHFRLFFNHDSFRENLNEGTINSLKFAIKLFKTARSKKMYTDLGILINDMGSSCGENSCSVNNFNFSRKDYVLPEKYLAILDSEDIPYKNIKIYWEKHIRNRGKKELLKRVKQNDVNIRKGPDGLYLNDPQQYGKIILTRKRNEDKYGVPACPLIMAGLNMEQNKRYPSSINFYYIGDDNIENVPNFFVIEKGGRVSELFGADIIVKNFYLNK